MESNKRYDLQLSQYERDNLLQLLRLVKTDPLLGLLDSGDWTKQVLWKLEPNDHRLNGEPNLTDDQARERIRIHLEGLEEKAVKGYQTYVGWKP